jgi:hypothetical protein
MTERAEVKSLDPDEQAELCCSRVEFAKLKPYQSFSLYLA